MNLLELMTMIISFSFAWIIRMTLMSFIFGFHTRFQRAKLMSIKANPVTSDGSSYQDITEQEAFLWFDEAYIHVRAGSGGAGSSAVKFGKARQHVAPTGGSGGKGGDVIITVDESINTLLGFRGKSSYRAENGEDGQLEFLNGKAGNDARIAVPKGTIVRDNSTNQIICEMNEARDEVIVAVGGQGGRGNAAMKVERERRSVDHHLKEEKNVC